MTEIPRIQRLSDRQGQQERKAKLAQRLFERGDQLMREALQAQPVQQASIIRAIDCFHQAIEARPDLEAPYLALAYISWRLGRSADALALLNTVQAQRLYSARAEALRLRIQT
ncbi:MAG: hypothetical protein IGS03_08635 [Candidatus Sericytochromatia bacterium]|nr:hypothetical protein [Candidatus Sericytochromatia bacterium]